MAYDGIVSRHLNRRFSRPVSRWLVATPLSPNAVTVLSTVFAIAMAGAVALGWNIAGGIGIQVASVADGIDGELARLRNAASRFGGFLDTIADRYADAAIVAGITVYAVRFEDLARPEVAGILALAGTLAVSYSKARVQASMPEPPNLDAAFGIASRDVRLLIAAAGTVAGQCYWTLVVLAVLTWATVAWRLVYLRGAPGAGEEPGH